MSDGSAREHWLITHEPEDLEDGFPGRTVEWTPEMIEAELARSGWNEDGSRRVPWPCVSWRYAGPEDEEVLRDRKHREARRDVNGRLVKDPDKVRELEERDRAIEIMKEERVAAWERALARAKQEKELKK